MDALQNLGMGFSIALTPANLLWCFIGVVAGTLVGVLPGLGPPATIALLLPLTLSLNPATSLIMMAGIYYGAKYGGSTTSILLNTPGESASVMTCLDGYALARQGRAGAALGMAAISSFVAGTVGVIGLTLLAPVIADAAIRIGPPEYFGLMLVGLSSVVLLTGRSLAKGLAAAAFGLLLSTMGTDVVTGVSRFTFGSAELLDGIDFIVLSVGLFAVAEVLINLEQTRALSVFHAPNRLRDLLPTWQDILACRFAMLQSSIVGFLIGALPGAGSTVAAFISYGIEKRASKHPERFGHGAIEGVAAPEGANNSETGGAMVPLLTLGIPGSGTTAIMLGALIIYGLQPGPLLFRERPEVVWPIIASMYVGNVMLLVLNLPFVPLFASVLRIPYRYLYPGILLLSVIGVYAVNQSVFDLWLLAGFGVLGYFLRKLDVPAAPIALAFVLGPLAERALRQSLIMSRGSLEIFATRPLAAILVVIALLLLVIPLVGRLNRTRTQVLDEEQ